MKPRRLIVYTLSASGQTYSMTGRRVAFPFPGESTVWTHVKGGRVSERDPRTVVAFGTRERVLCPNLIAKERRMLNLPCISL